MPNNEPSSPRQVLDRMERQLLILHSELDGITYASNEDGFDIALSALSHGLGSYIGGAIRAIREARLADAKA